MKWADSEMKSYEAEPQRATWEMRNVEFGMRK